MNNKPIQPDELNVLESADVIVAISHDELHHADSPEKGIARVSVLRNALGETGKSILAYQSETKTYHHVTSV